MNLKTLRPGSRQDAGEIRINGEPYHLFVCRTLTHEGEPVLGMGAGAPGIVLLSYQFGKRLLAYTAANFAAALWQNRGFEPPDFLPWHCASSVLVKGTRYDICPTRVGVGDDPERFVIDTTHRDIRLGYGTPAQMARAAIAAVDAAHRCPTWFGGKAEEMHKSGDYHPVSRNPGGPRLDMRCSHCGATYRESRWLKEHLLNRHGVTDPRMGCIPLPGEFVATEVAAQAERRAA